MGDSGTPLVIETSPLKQTLVGIQHGVRTKVPTCVPGNNQTVTALFVSLEHEENMSFIEKWLSLGEYFASKDTSDTEMFYLKKLDPHMRYQNLWTYYPSNDDIYSRFETFAKTQHL